MTEPDPTRRQTHTTHRGTVKQIDGSSGKSPLVSHGQHSSKNRENVAPSASKYETWGGGVFAPQYTNQKDSADSITSVVVLNVIPSAKSAVPNAEKEKTRDSKVSKIAKIFKGTKEEKDGGNAGLMKVVFMPRRDYEKWFAKDDKGVYIGTEPSMEWTEDELEQKFSAYRPPKAEQGITAGSIDRMLTAKARGL